VSSGENDGVLGDKLLQIFDEFNSHRIGGSRGRDVYAGVSDLLFRTDRGADVVSFDFASKRYTFRCFDFFISGLGAVHGAPVLGSSTRRSDNCLVPRFQGARSRYWSLGN
jgi:hypothetical protein